MNNKSKKYWILIITAILVALGLIIASMIIASSIRYFKDSDRSVEVKGLAEKLVKADQASWQITLSASSIDLKGIYSAIKNEQNILIDFVNKQGFTDVNITKQPISIRDNYADSMQMDSKKSLRYSATAMVIIMSLDVNKIANAVQNTNSLVESGVIISYSDVSYLYNGLNSIKTEMLNEALANAKIAGEQFAKQSGSHLGAIKNASQGLFGITAPDGSSYNNSTVDKKVRIVTSVKYILQ